MYVFNIYRDRFYRSFTIIIRVRTHWRVEIDNELDIHGPPGSQISG